MIQNMPNESKNVINGTVRQYNILTNEKQKYRRSLQHASTTPDGGATPNLKLETILSIFSVYVLFRAFKK